MWWEDTGTGGVSVAVGGPCGAVGPLAREGRVWHLALALCPSFWFLGGRPCAPLLFPHVPPLSHSGPSPAFTPAPAPHPPSRSLDCLDVRFLGCTNHPALRALFCCVSFHAFLLLFGSMMGGRRPCTASAEPDACRHCWTAFAPVLDARRAPPLQEWSPLFFLWHVITGSAPLFSFLGMASLILRRGACASAPRPHRAARRSPCWTGGAATPSTRSPPSLPGASKPRRPPPSPPRPFLRVTCAHLMRSVMQQAPARRLPTRSLPLLPKTAHVPLPTAVTPWVLLTTGAAGPRRPACH